MRLREALSADYKHYCRYFKYPKRFFLLNGLRILIAHPGYAAVISYRFSHHLTYGVRFKPFRILLKLLNFPFFLWARGYSGCEISRDAKIGGGLVIVHFGGIIVSHLAKIGSNCVMHQGCNIVESHNGAATIGDNAYIGARVVFVGPCVIGNNVSIGAGAVVTRDCPDDVVLAGVPAKVIRDKSAVTAES